MGKEHSMVGAQAPSITLPSIPKGEPFTLPIGSKPIAVFFFPAANTTGCTKEACAFRDAQASNEVFKRHDDLVVVGISGDSTTKQQAFADQYGLKYPILSDDAGEARRAFKVSKTGFGLFDGRETFFIDPSGKIRGVCTKMIDAGAHHKFIEEQLVALEKERS